MAPYEFRGKPGDPRRRPPQIAPYHLRLDWLMWFLPLSVVRGGRIVVWGHERWFIRMVEQLLVGEGPIERLLRHDPLPDRPPSAIRARLYRYRFTDRDERRRSGAWWTREPVGEYLPAVTLEAPAR